MTAIVSINHNNMTSWTIISGTFRTFCKKSYNFLQFIKNTEEQKYWCYDSPLSCRGCSTIAQQSFFYVAKDNFTHSPPPEMLHSVRISVSGLCMARSVWIKAPWPSAVEYALLLAVNPGAGYEPEPPRF